MDDTGKENIIPTNAEKKPGIIGRAVGGVRRLFSKPKVVVVAHTSSISDADYQDALRAFNGADGVRADLPLMEKDPREIANMKAKYAQRATLNPIQGTNTYERPTADVLNKPQTVVQETPTKEEPTEEPIAA